MWERAEHALVTPEDRAREWAAGAGLLVAHTRRPGSYAETDSTLTAWEVATGRCRWQQQVESVPPRQPLALDGDLLVVVHGPDRPQLRGYDAATGAPRWSYRLTGEPRGALVVDGDVVVVSGSTVHRVGRDGTPVAIATVRGSALTTLALTDDGDLVVGNGRGRDHLLRLDAGTLEVRWAATVPGERWLSSRPVLIDGGTAYLHAASAWAMALDVATGEVRWKRRKAPGRDGALLPGPEGDPLWGTDFLARIRARDGRPLWTVPDVVAAAATSDRARVVVARAVDGGSRGLQEEPMDVRLELLDATTGATLDPLDLGTVERHWPAGGMSDRLFAVVDGALHSGLQPGRLRVIDLGLPG